MTTVVRLFFIVSTLMLQPIDAHAQWQAAETIKTYAIAGQSGAELYASIGARGPRIDGNRRAIAHTSFKLTWSRAYEPRGESCVLVSANPRLVITYTLPAPAEPLPADTAQRWKTFIAGVAAHERVHGAMIRDMVSQIERASIGLTVSGDRGCGKIRTELTRRLSVISDKHRKRNRDFDKAELSNSGNIHTLILDLVNGQ